MEETKVSHRHNAPAAPQGSNALTPFSGGLSTELGFRSRVMPREGYFPCHDHPFGEFVYVYMGVLQLGIGGQSYIAPAGHGIWLPPGHSHDVMNHRETEIGSLDVGRKWAATLPRTPLVYDMSPLFRAIFEHCRHDPPQLPQTPSQERLLRVALDCLHQAKPVGSFLPSTQDPLVSPVLAILQEDPGDRRGVAELARVVGTTERTLSRRSLAALGMSLVDWRQRLRVVSALSLLEKGEKVAVIARRLGYGSASSFIAMFRRQMGQSPDEYRKALAERGLTGAEGNGGINGQEANS